MPMVPFYEVFPDLAFKETRCALIQSWKGLPDGEYAFIEYYCDELGCDCRRVFIIVISRDTAGETLATINYGWESAEFYVEWMGDDTDIESLKGPALAPPPAQQTKLAPYLLELYKEAALEDPRYINRLRKHYKMFKRAIENGHRLQNRSKARSGKKYRKQRKK